MRRDLWPWDNFLCCRVTRTNEMQIEHKEKENHGLHCHRYALKLTCQTLKVCALTHASLNIASHNVAWKTAVLRIKPLCGALAREIIRCSISFCVEKVLRIVLYIFFIVQSLCGKLYKEKSYLFKWITLWLVFLLACVCVDVCVKFNT